MGGRGTASGFPTNQPGQSVAQPQQETLEDYLGQAGTPLDLDTAMKRANPNYQTSKANGDGKYTKNCQRCVWAVELLRRGYDVEAMPRTADNDYASLDENKPHSFVNGGDPPLNFTGWIGNYWYPAKATDVKNEILKNPDGSRGALVMMAPGRGHVCNWEIVKGKVVIYDGQVNQKRTMTDILGRGWKTFQVARMDNVAITDLAKDLVKRRQA